MLTLPWIILYVLLGIAVVMHILSWTSVYKKVTPVLRRDAKLGVIGQTKFYYIVLFGTPKAHTLAHELVHIRQQWRYTWLVVALLRMSKKMRLRLELPAYAAGFSAGRDLNESASAMKKSLKLDMTVEEAKKLILKHSD